MPFRSEVKRAVAVMSLTLACSEAYAFDLAATLYSDVEYSDNVHSVSAQTKDDVIQTVGLDLALLETRKTFQVNGNFNLEAEHYYDNSYSDQSSLTTGIGLFNFDLIEAFLNWSTSFTRTQVLVDSSATNTPDNRGHKDIFRSGPSVNYKASDTSRFVLTANYVNVQNSEAIADDTERADSSFGYIHRINPLTDLTFNALYGESIDAEEGDGFVNANANIGFVRRFVRGDLRFSYGKTKLTPDDSESTTGNFFDVKLNREQVLWHDIGLQYQQDISDTSIGFASDEHGNANEDDPLRGLSVSDVIKRKRVTLSAKRILGNYSYTTSGFWEQQTYVMQESDENSHGINFRLDQQISPGLTAGFEYTFRVSDYVDRPLIGKDKLNRYQVDSRYELSEDLSVNGFVGFSVRSNDQNSVREYEELSLGVGLSWLLY